MMEPATRFLNIDLEIRSRSNLQPLIDAIEKSKRAHALYSFWRGGVQQAGFEIDTYITRIDEIIETFARAVGSLRGQPKRLWSCAIRRDLNIGIQAGLAGATFTFDANSAALAARMNARIVFTIYGARMKRWKASKKTRLGSSS